MHSRNGAIDKAVRYRKRSFAKGSPESSVIQSSRKWHRTLPHENKQIERTYRSRRWFRILTFSLSGRHLYPSQNMQNLLLHSVSNKSFHFLILLVRQTHAAVANSQTTYKKLYSGTRQKFVKLVVNILSIMLHQSNNKLHLSPPRTTEPVGFEYFKKMLFPPVGRIRYRGNNHLYWKA